jgi:hypothetical protein
VTNAQHTIENDGYEYTAKPLQQYHGLYYPHAVFYAHFMAAFTKAQKEWEEKVAADPSLEYADSCYLYSMTLGMAGMPAALIMNVDDSVQTFLYEGMERIEEDPK